MNVKKNQPAKYPHSMEIFKFAYKVVSYQKGDRAHNQDVGVILGLSAPDCSHWKRGAKKVQSVFDLQKISEALGVERSLLFDLSYGVIEVDEAYFEFLEMIHTNAICAQLSKIPRPLIVNTRKKILKFIQGWHKVAELKNPPLFIPEVVRGISFVDIQPADVINKLSRILRIRSSSYLIHYRQGDLGPQTRVSIAKNLAQVLLEAERHRYPELGEIDYSVIEYEKFLFTTELLCPRSMVSKEAKKISPKADLTSELASIFWVPRVLINYQLKSLLISTYAPQHSLETPRKGSAPRRKQPPPPAAEISSQPSPPPPA